MGSDLQGSGLAVRVFSSPSPLPSPLGRGSAGRRSPDRAVVEVRDAVERVPTGSANSWLLLDSGAGDHAFNMALDEALLEAMPRLLNPVLRFYGWKAPAASFGYFQRYAEVERFTLLRPLVRRPAGGGLVPHDRDWTYSLAFPTDHEWYSVNAAESYRRVHAWLRAAFARVGVSTELADCSRRTRAGQCFAGYEKNDLLWHGQKIAGAAQRRTRAGLLIQGSVQPPKESLDRADWQRAMVEVGTSKAVAWSKFEPDRELQLLLRSLVERKYSQESYNQKR